MLKQKANVSYASRVIRTKIAATYTHVDWQGSYTHTHTHLYLEGELQRYLPIRVRHSTVSL